MLIGSLCFALIVFAHEHDENTKSVQIYRFFEQTLKIHTTEKTCNEQYSQLSIFDAYKTQLENVTVEIYKAR